MDSWLLFLILISITIYGAIFIYLHRGLAGLTPGRNTNLPKVSIIVAARNEEKWLQRCLNALARQNYPRELLEIIPVNDRSEDETGKRILEFCEQQTNAFFVEIPKNHAAPSPKKWALSQGIQAAGGEILCFTDADCEPPPAWISEIVRCFEPGVEMVVGFSPLVSVKKSIWSGIIELDSLNTAAIAAATLGRGEGATCTGRNLAYTTQIFQALNGFHKIEHSLSGDDDLFLHEVQQLKPGSARFCWSPKSLVPAQRLIGIRAFLRQRRRHFSAGGKYPMKIKMGYLALHASNFILFNAFFGSLFFNQFLMVAALCLSAKFWVDFILLNKFGRILNYTHPLKYFFVWEFYYYFLNSFIAPTVFVGKIRWK